MVKNIVQPKPLSLLSGALRGAGPVAGAGPGERASPLEVDARAPQLHLPGMDDDDFEGSDTGSIQLEQGAAGMLQVSPTRVRGGG